MPAQHERAACAHAGIRHSAARARMLHCTALHRKACTHPVCWQGVHRPASGALRACSPTTPCPAHLARPAGGARASWAGAAWACLQKRTRGATCQSMHSQQRLMRLPACAALHRSTKGATAPAPAAPLLVHAALLVHACSEAGGPHGGLRRRRPHFEARLRRLQMKSNNKHKTLGLEASCGEWVLVSGGGGGRRFRQCGGAMQVHAAGMHA